MNEHVRAAGELDEVGYRTGIAGDDDRASAAVEAVAERRHDGTVIDGERRHTHGAVIKDHSFVDDMGVDPSAGGGMLLHQVAANVDVFREEVQHRSRQPLYSQRSVELEGPRFPSELPRRVEEVRQAGRVIGVQVGEEDGAERLILQIGRRDAQRRAAAGVDDEPPLAGHDGQRRPGMRGIGTRIAGTEQDGLEARKGMNRLRHKRQRNEGQSESGGESSPRQRQAVRG